MKENTGRVNVAIFTPNSLSERNLWQQWTNKHPIEPIECNLI